jgi:signal transduction histidine kinase
VTPSSDTRPEPSLEARQLAEYLRFAALPNFVFAPLLLALWLWVPEPTLLLLSAEIALNGAMTFWGRRILARGEIDRAVFIQAVSLWLIAFTLGLGGLNYFALTTIMSVLPLALAVPYVSVSAVLRMALVAVGIVVATGLLIVTREPVLLRSLPIATMLPVLSLGIVALVAVTGLSLWHTKLTLSQAADELRESNLALRESEAGLEQRVRERTADLEQSQRELAVARDEALAANRHKSAFLANMSHELRTPLNAIIGFSEVLGERIFGELNEKQAEYIGDIHQSGHHLLSLINDILDLSKIEAGRLELQLDAFMLPQTVENALVLMKERAARRQVELVRELAPAVGKVVADERKIKQVLINLLSNAVKFTPAGGRVTVRVDLADPDTLRLEVRDDGIGIKPEDHALIFEEFRQASGNYAQKQEGTGLGLALSKRLVEAHGGHIGVVSALGEGSTFWFTLPLQASPRS